jgi:hypothetical protein
MVFLSKTRPQIVLSKKSVRPDFTIPGDRDWRGGFGGNVAAERVPDLKKRMLMVPVQGQFEAESQCVSMPIWLVCRHHVNQIEQTISVVFLMTSTSLYDRRAILWPDNEHIRHPGSNPGRNRL